MKQQLLSFIDWFKRLVGGEKLHGEFYRFLLVHMGFLIFTNLPGIFINTMLIGQTNDFAIVMLYNAVFFLTSAFSMFIAASLQHRTNPGIIAIIGVVCYNLLYLFLFLQSENAANHYILLGALTGLADGFYWLSYGNLLSDTTDLSNRDSALAMISLGLSFVKLLVPLVSGAIISGLQGTKGYLVVFGLAFAFSLLTAIAAMRLPSSKKKTHGGGTNYPATMRLIWQDKKLLYGLMGQGAKGIREGAFLFILSVVLYQLVSSELMIGLNSFFSNLFGILSYVVAGRILTRRNRIGHMYSSVIILTIMSVASVVRPGSLSVWVFTVVNAFFSGFLENSCLDMLQLNGPVQNHRPEMLALNEGSLVVGRLIGVGIILALHYGVGPTVSVQLLSLLLLTLTQFGTAALCGKAMRLAQQQDKWATL